ncbi:MAG TPA: tetratricopeptide repeat protein [candidate division Zixibacteria bacterium]|nr:tetratricopeptide repeat protein [candidate division Zixibacteria bacterium]
MRSILLTGLLLLIAASGFTQNTDSLKFYLNQGRDQFKKRHYEQAYESLQKVLGYDPTSYEAIKMLAVSAINIGKAEDGRKLFEKAYQINPKDKDICNNLGALYSNLGQSTRALEFYQQAYQIDTANALLMTNMGQEYLKLGQVGKAIPLLQRAFPLEPEKPIIAYLLGNCFAAAEINDSALYYYNKALEKKKTDAELYYRLGTVQRKLGKTDDAVESFQRSLDIDPNQRDCKQALAMILFNRGEFSDAAGWFESIAIDYPDYYPSFIGLGVCRGMLNDLAASDSILTRLFSVDSTMGFQMLQMLQDTRTRQGGSSSH